MTTAQTHAENSVPLYFNEFTQKFGEYRVENERQHGELGQRVDALRGEMHREFVSQLRWMIGLGIVMIASLGGSVVYSAIYVASRLE